MAEATHLQRRGPAETAGRGVSKLARAVRGTLGPRGRNAVLDKGWGSPNVTKDGVTVAEEIELTDPYENMGAQLVKEAASKTSDVAGDGTTTATVLAEAIYREGLKMHRRRPRSDGPDPRHPEGASRRSSRNCKKLAEKIDAKDEKEITEVATIASNNNPEIGKKLAEAMKLVGATNGVITIEEGKTADTEVVVVQGMQFDRGYLSPHFVTNQESMIVELENPYILIYEEKISSAKNLIPLLETISKKKEPLLDHRRGHRRRGPGDPGAQQAQGHPAGLRRQGARLRRSPQGHARRHRHPDRRQGDLQGPRHPARERPSSTRPGPGQEGQDRRREHDHHRRRRRQEGHRRPGRDDPPRDRRRPTASTTARSCRSGWPSWPAAWPRSRSGPPPRPR